MKVSSRYSFGGKEGRIELSRFEIHIYVSVLSGRLGKLARLPDGDAD